MSDDTWGCLTGTLALVVIGWWLYSHYEIRKIPDHSVSAVASATPADAPQVMPVPRPTGIVEAASGRGVSWTVNADTVSGPRSARLGWITEDASKAKDRLLYKTAKMLWQVDCQTLGVRQLSLVDYDAAGNVMFSNSSDPKDAKVNYNPPDTAGGELASYLCDPLFDEPRK